jgi:hypothetical protein
MLNKTAQFWCSYIKIVHLYKNFIKSIRTGNFEMYVVLLPDIINYFFAMNHPNYARWSVKYHNNLLQLENTHPEVYNDFKRGLFGLKRTNKSYSRIPIDLTLEQTINADAASQRMGISYLTDSISARLRWAYSHYLRTAVISEIFEQYGMTQKEDVTNDLKFCKRKNDHDALDKIKVMIKDTMNPFDTDIEKTHLYNLATGKSVKIETEKFLLNIEHIGNTARRNFIKECSEDDKRFESPIKAQKLLTFATEIRKKKITRKDGKVISACLIRDLFGSLLFLALQKQVDMNEVLKYPLTPLPLTLARQNQR